MENSKYLIPIGIITAIAAALGGILIGQNTSHDQPQIIIPTQNQTTVTNQTNMSNQTTPTPTTSNQSALSNDVIKRDVLTKLSLAIENNYTKIQSLNISIVGDTNGGSILVYNKTSFYHLPPPVIPPPVVIPPNDNTTSPPNNTTIPPVVTPPAGPKIYELVFAGDVKGTTLLQPLKTENANMTVINGDLGYAPDIKTYVSTYGSLKNDRCTQGNHDSDEDGNTKIAADTLAYCGQHWFSKVAGGTSIVIGFTTNGNAMTEAAYVNSITGNKTLMQGVKNVFLSSHKNAHVPTNSEHGAEAKLLYDAIKQDIQGVTFYQVNAHNHFLAGSDAKHWYISGAGGKSHYRGEADQDWNFFNNKVWGYLKFSINEDTGAVKANFYDSNNKVLG